MICFNLINYLQNYRIKEIYFILLKQYTINQKNIKSIKKNKDDEKTTMKCFFCGHDKLRSPHKHPCARWKYYKICNKGYNYLTSFKHA